MLRQVCQAGRSSGRPLKVALPYARSMASAYSVHLRAYSSLLARRPAYVPRAPVLVASPAQLARWYSDVPKLTYEVVTERVLNVVKAFDKVDASKVTISSSFQKDLGIDSLDAVELVMALEDEFVIQIPDEEAEKITSCEEAINYISTHPHAK
eukprot:TRINITY_DN23498_c0_g1_i1.p2 TRINITY_DN23498_c0_g1~~TRINITY_DN23498_c0_g1_i1.p2  ORF type:complete len:153 (+),score=7.04 TRINITY_DN23498_c0_g1_i1:36-494(+)